MATFKDTLTQTNTEVGGIIRSIPTCIIPMSGKTLGLIPLQSPSLVAADSSQHPAYLLSEASSWGLSGGERSIITVSRNNHRLQPPNTWTPLLAPQVRFWDISIQDWDILGFWRPFWTVSEARSCCDFPFSQIRATSSGGCLFINRSGAFRRNVGTPHGAISVASSQAY